jgi:BirA family transcriptional regulator, biotin operon repressor / biotin---[acetyl-CoA-carboxylase] ligase
VTEHLPVKFPAKHYDTIDSTNSEAERLAAAGESGPLWIVAAEQNGGRGRNGRVWHSPPGGVYATLLYPINLPLRRMAELGAAMSLAVRAALSEFIPADALVLKWPNDCLVRGAKICGILSETCGQKPLRVAIGCGINVENKPSGLTYATAAVRDFQPDATVSQVFDSLNRASAQVFLDLAERDAGAVWREWQRYAQPVGTPIRVRGGQLETDGTFAGLADDGALILQDKAGQRHVVHAADVMMGQG